MPESAPSELLARLESVRTAWIKVGNKSLARTLKAAEEVFFDQFAPLAVELVRLYPDTFPDPENPPPYDIAKGITERIAGTHRTDVAGRRIVFWAAAIHDPRRFHRSDPTGRNELKDWARSWMIYKDESPNRKHPFRTAHQPIIWAVDAATVVIGDLEAATAQTAPRLTVNLQAAFDLIASLEKPAKGTVIARKLGISVRTFLKHYAPALRLHGMKNKGGYFIERT